MSRISSNDLAQELVEIARHLWRLTHKTTPETWCKNAHVALERTAGVYAGRYLRDPEPKVLVNSKTSPRDTRFVVAHELGHHLIAECRHSVGVRREVSASAMRKLGNIIPASDEEEELCDQFAGVLLLPAATAETWARSSRCTATSVVSLASAHDITVGACVHQLTTVVGFDKTVVVIGPDGHVMEVFGQEWPLTPNCRPAQRLVDADVLTWGDEPRWLRWTRTLTGATYSTKVTAIVNSDGGAVMLIHLLGRHYEARSHRVGVGD